MSSTIHNASRSTGGASAINNMNGLTSANESDSKEVSKLLKDIAAKYSAVDEYSPKSASPLANKSNHSPLFLGALALPISRRKPYLEQEDELRFLRQLFFYNFRLDPQQAQQIDKILNIFLDDRDYEYFHRKLANVLTYLHPVLRENFLAWFIARATNKNSTLLAISLMEKGLYSSFNLEQQGMLLSLFRSFFSFDKLHEVVKIFNNTIEKRIERSFLELFKNLLVNEEQKEQIKNIASKFFHPSEYSMFYLVCRNVFDLLNPEAKQDFLGLFIHYCTDRDAAISFITQIERGLCFLNSIDNQGVLLAKLQELAAVANSGKDIEELKQCLDIAEVFVANFTLDLGVRAKLFNILANLLEPKNYSAFDRNLHYAVDKLSPALKQGFLTSFIRCCEDDASTMDAMLSLGLGLNCVRQDKQTDMLSLFNYYHLAVWRDIIKLLRMDYQTRLDNTLSLFEVVHIRLDDKELNDLRKILAATLPEHKSVEFYCELDRVTKLLNPEVKREFLECFRLCCVNNSSAYVFISCLGVCLGSLADKEQQAKLLLMFKESSVDDWPVVAGLFASGRGDDVFNFFSKGDDERKSAILKGFQRFNLSSELIEKISPIMKYLKQEDYGKFYLNLKSVRCYLRSNAKKDFIACLLANCKDRESTLSVISLMGSKLGGFESPNKQIDFFQSIITGAVSDSEPDLDLVPGRFCPIPSP